MHLYFRGRYKKKNYKNIASWKVNCMIGARSGGKKDFTIYSSLKKPTKITPFVARASITYVKIKYDSRTEQTVHPLL